MSTARRLESHIVPEAGFRSHEVAVKVAELAALHVLLREAVAGLTPEQLGRQLAPGRNTLGMLLAHIAVAETHLGQVGLVGDPSGHVQDVLGIREDDDGLPLSADGTPPVALAGRDLVFFLDLLARAAAHTRLAGQDVTDELLGHEIVRPPRPDGTVRVFDRRWVMFHMVEHAAQHLGQIRVLAREVRAATPA